MQTLKDIKIYLIYNDVELQLQLLQLFPKLCAKLNIFKAKVQAKIGFAKQKSGFSKATGYSNYKYVRASDSVCVITVIAHRGRGKFSTAGLS